jgi:hypothetical protein
MLRGAAWPVRRWGVDPDQVTLDDLHGAPMRGASWLVDLVQPEIGGGRLDASGLAALDERPGATALRVSGLDQKMFEALVSGYGGRFTAIHFWKCPRIQDLSPLESLPHLRLVSFYWNQRADRLWDLGRTPDLTGLRFHDFTRLHDLGDLVRGSSLVELDFGDAVWDTLVVETLEPLASLPGLRSLKLSAKKIEDGRVEPLGHLQQLGSLAFSSKQFTMRQVAWLRARLPESLVSEALEPLRRFAKPLTVDGKQRDVLLVGKRKPFLSSVEDEARIRKHVADFDGLVAEFRADPSRLPE